jgi:hypothetical protein
MVEVQQHTNNAESLDDAGSTPRASSPTSGISGIFGIPVDPILSTVRHYTDSDSGFEIQSLDESENPIMNTSLTIMGGYRTGPIELRVSSSSDNSIVHLHLSTSTGFVYSVDIQGLAHQISEHSNPREEQRGA